LRQIPAHWQFTVGGRLPTSERQATAVAITSQRQLAFALPRFPAPERNSAAILTRPPQWQLADLCAGHFTPRWRRRSHRPIVDLRPLRQQIVALGRQSLRKCLIDHHFVQRIRIVGAIVVTQHIADRIGMGIDIGWTHHLSQHFHLGHSSD
jgi:hypothetical protein